MNTHLKPEVCFAVVPFCQKITCSLFKHCQRKQTMKVIKKNNGRQHRLSDNM